MQQALVFAPAELLSINEITPLFGRYFMESDVYNIVPPSAAQRDPATYAPLGQLLPESSPLPEGHGGLLGRVEGESIRFMVGEKPYDAKFYCLENDLFSRNTGILETTKLLDRHAMIVGCGSVGSLFALELARSGVGRFTLIDHDIVEYHNLARHQCSMMDVGDYKVNALSRRILEINPAARIVCHKGTMETLPEDAFFSVGKEDTLVVGCADNRAADV